MNNDCPFCDLDNVRGRIVHKFKYCYAILSHPRKIPGHLLLIPNRHVSKFSELNEHEKTEIFDKMIFYQEKMLEHAQGTMIKNNYMPFVPDSRIKVTHLHIHISPRYLNDALKAESDAVDFTDPDPKEMEEWVRKLQ